MKATALLALLTLSPALAASQHVEFTPFVGRYQPIASAWSTAGVDINCAPGDCDFVYLERVTRQPAAAVGGTVSVRYSSRFGIQAVVQHARAVNPLSGFDYGRGASFDATERVTTTFVALQPSVWFRIGELVDVGVSGGPAIALLDAASTNARLSATRSRTYAGFAMASAVRARVADRIGLELRASDTWTFGSGGPTGASHHLIYGVGLAFGVNE
jgi:hypothetical protein